MRNLWPNQTEALRFLETHRSAMLDMDMGTGKTLVAITAIMRWQRSPVLIVCPKSVMSVWVREFAKHGPYEKEPCIWTSQGNRTVRQKGDDLRAFLDAGKPGDLRVAVINYDIVWRVGMREAVFRMLPMAVVLDESHRAKAAGTKVSRFLALVGKSVPYKLCLTGTPMANSPLDLYGQYRFLDPSIFGTRYDLFRDRYAIMGGPERNFVVGYKNQDLLMKAFRSIAYSCKLSDIADRLKLPPKLPPQTVVVRLPEKDMKLARKLVKEFIAQDEASGGTVVFKNVLTKFLRLQQITSGFVAVQDEPLAEAYPVELNTAKEDALADLLLDIPSSASVVVFVVFKHDIGASMRAAAKANRGAFEVSGRVNQLDQWRERGGVLVVQIQAGAEGIDLTKAHHAVYFSLPTALGTYEQSLARLYRPGQQHPVTFAYLIAEKTIDEDMLESLQNKKSLIDDFIHGRRDYGFL